MIKASEIIGIPVMDKSNRKRLCNVKDIVYSKEMNKIIALLISKKSLITNAKFILFKDINVITERSIIIDNVKTIKSSSSNYDSNNYFYNDYLMSMEVFTECNENIGYIKDIIINNKNGEIAAFQLTDGLFEDLINGRNVVPFNENVRFSESSLIISEKFKKELQENNTIYKKLLG